MLSKGGFEALGEIIDSRQEQLETAKIAYDNAWGKFKNGEIAISDLNDARSLVTIFRARVTAASKLYLENVPL